LSIRSGESTQVDFVRRRSRCNIRGDHVVYPHGGREGIGPLAGISVPVLQRDQVVETIRIRSPDGRLDLLGESDGITVREVGP
jgi:hypothetical protein